ncbi:vacuolar protein-sorting-associated protein 36-like [Calliphora vicina]|uniref:vacuolar protein-sorting-associated protein 36-like n=1 Tax=Calliphora vicina TaxID=7373 RepID=UPI00325A52F3
MLIKINWHLCVFLLIFNYFHYGGTVNYNPYASNQPHLLHATNSDNDDYKNNAPQPATNDYTVYRQSQQNLQGNSNYQQLYRYYYTPPYQQQMQPPQPTQLWSGPPIVVEDDIQQQQQQSSSTANIPPTLYQQRSTTTSSMLLPSLHRNSKALPPPVYSPQNTRTTQFDYNNNNNHNIVYHRDFRHQIDAIPESKHTTQPDIVSWNNQQQQHQLLEPQQQQEPQQFYATNTNLRYNGISNDLTSLRKDNVPDYGEHFKRYLENNPHRIRPIY